MKKEPAHEVIMSLIESTHSSLLQMGGQRELYLVAGSTIQERVNVLLDVLERMIIPEKELPEVISRLKSILKNPDQNVKEKIERTLKIIDE